MAHRRTIGNGAAASPARNNGAAFEVEGGYSSSTDIREATRKGDRKRCDERNLIKQAERLPVNALNRETTVLAVTSMAASACDQFQNVVGWGLTAIGCGGMAFMTSTASLNKQLELASLERKKLSLEMEKGSLEMAKGSSERKKLSLEMDIKMEKLSLKMDKGFTDLMKRLDTSSAVSTEIDGKSEEPELQTEDIETPQKKFDARLEGLSKEADTLDRKIQGAQDRIDQINSQIRGIVYKIEVLRGGYRTRQGRGISDQPSTGGIENGGDSPYYFQI